MVVGCLLPFCLIVNSEARDLLEIVEARHKKASTIFCSQFDIAGWHMRIGEPTHADAICDRIVHDTYKIVIEGDPMRKKKGITFYFSLWGSGVGGAAAKSPALIRAQ